MKSGNYDGKFWYLDFKLVTSENGEKNKLKNEGSEHDVPRQVANHNYYCKSNLKYNNARNQNTLQVKREKKI